MQKPENYDDIKTGGGYTPIALGGHYLTIVKVEETKSAKGNDMTVVYFDTAKNDAQPGYFKAEFDRDSRSGKKWPNSGTTRIMKSSPSRLKTFMTSVEDSNPGFKVKWDDELPAGTDWGAQFRGKKVGGVFGEVENEYNGKIRNRIELRWFCSVARVPSEKVPEAKPLKKKDTMSDGSGFIGIPVNADSEELPFL